MIECTAKLLTKFHLSLERHLVITYAFYLRVKKLNREVRFKF
jgi:hypothetical protein